MSTRPIRYPRVRTEQSETVRHHPIIVVQYAPDQPEHHYCGDSWCTGERCGLPALVLNHPDDPRVEMKTYSAMVACGYMMQRWRVTWKGAKEQVPSEHVRDFLKRMWL